MTHPALSHPEQRACIEALYRANPEGTAELLMAFPEGTFERCEEHSKRLEGERPKRPQPAQTAGAVSKGKAQVERYAQGRLM
jgi:hypothetical protein